jgi:hypothetical protein
MKCYDPHYTFSIERSLFSRDKDVLVPKLYAEKIHWGNGCEAPYMISLFDL